MISESIRKSFDSMFCCCVVDDISMIDDGKPVTRPTRIGGSILLCGKRKTKFPYQCLIGPDWPVVVLVYILIVFINAIILGVTSPLGWPPLLIGLVGTFVLLMAYSAVACSDPGIVYKNDFTPMTDGGGGDIEDPMCGSNSSVNTNVVSSQPRTLLNVPNSIECGQCDFRRPYSARHCGYCKVCIDELDHHCPWYSTTILFSFIFTLHHN
jgi:hypothetical protein